MNTCQLEQELLKLVKRVNQLEDAVEELEGRLIDIQNREEEQ